MKLLAVLILILLAVWVIYALRNAKKHSAACGGDCGNCDGCKNKKE